MILSYCEGESPLHRLNPLSKLSAVFAGGTLLFMFGSLLHTVAGFAIVVAIAYFNGSGQVLQVVRTRFASFLGLWLIVANSIFTPAGRVLLTIPFYLFHVTVTDVGLLTGITMAIRFLAIFLISALFVSTTEPAALVYSLMRRGLPYRYGFMLVVMMRFVPVFDRERKTVSAAQKMRGLEIDKHGIKKLYRSLRFTLVPLIVSALSKVDNLVMSMEGRAFGYLPVRTFTFEDRYKPRDKALIFFSLTIVVFALAGRMLGWNFLQGTKQ
jgi:energy-coupling factor transport system permease protein